MPSNDSTVTIKADISKLKSEMQAAARQVRVVNSEFKAATAGMDDWTKSEEGLTAKLKQLNGTLEQQKKQLALMNEELEKTIELDGEGAASVDRVRIAINNQVAAIAKTEKSIEDYNKQLEELPENMEDTSEAAEKASEGFTVFKAALADLVADGIRATISALKDLAQEAIQVGMSFESEMSKVGAISGASAEEIGQLTDKAKELGESSVFSASEAASAFEYMAMAGWKTEDMLSGVQGIMDLAAASNEDLATTSDIVTDALTAMGYAAKDAGRLADVMASASSNSNTNVALMGKTFQYVAPLVGALGYNMEDTAVAIGLMANAGIKGEKSGTALRSVLNRLSAPPKECAEEMEKLGISLTDSEGNMKSLRTVMTDLRGAFSKLSETEQTAAAKHIAGAEAMSGLLAVVNASDQDFQKLTVAINNSEGAASKMAETMTDNVGGKLTLLKSKIEGIMIKLFERASGSMKKGIETVGKALDQVDWNKVGDEVGKFAEKAAEMFSYIISNSSQIISVLKTIGTVFGAIFVAQKISATVSAIQTFITAVKGAGTAAQLLSSALGALGISMSALPVIAVAAGIAGLYAYTKKQEAETRALIKANYGLTDSQKKVIDAAHESAEALKAANEARKEEGKGIDLQYDKLAQLKDQYNGLIDKNGHVKAGSEELANVLLGQLAEGLGTTIDKIKENIGANGQLSASIDELIEKKKTEAKLAAFKDDYEQALKDEVANFKALKEAKDADNEAQKKLNQAQAEYNAALDKFENNPGDKYGADKKAVDDAKLAFEAATESANETRAALNETSQTWGNTQSTIEFYNQAMAASMEGDSEKVNAALISMQNGFTNYTIGSKQAMEDQVNTTQKDLDLIREMYSKGLISDTVLTDQEQALNISKGLLDDWVAKNDSASSEAAAALGKNTSDGFLSMQNVVEEMSKNTLQSLDNDLGDWGEVAERKTDGLFNVMNNKKGEAEKVGAELAEAPAKGAESKASDMEAPAEKAVEAYTNKISEGSTQASDSAKVMVEGGVQGAEDSAKDMEKPAESAVTSYSDGIKNKAPEVETAGKELPKAAAKGADSEASQAQTSGENFGQGFLNGIESFFSAVFEKAKQLGQRAAAGLKQGQEEGSPSKVTYRSGKFFGEGYENGIEATKKAVTAAAGAIAKSAVSELKKAQKEGSPSQLTYESGQMFTQGYINGIASLEKTLVSTTKGLVNKALAELLKLKNFNFDEVATNASNVFSSGFQKQLNYMIDRINYQNQQMLKDFDNTSANLQAQADQEVADAQAASQKKQNKIQKKIDKQAEKEQTKATKKKTKKLKNQLTKEKEALDKATDEINKSYDAQIEQQKKMKEAYQQASASMISEFQQAMQEYQTAAQKLIDDTINSITSEYQSQYDALISKQDNLIQKLKSAGDLFNLSNANVMTLNDIQEQTATIKQYANKLATIKKKVSGDLFDQIANYDMKEGEAFIDRLLAMTDKELKAYSDAYDEKMRVSESLSESIYKSDLDKVAANYKSAMTKAMAGLPAQLEQLGWQSMQGFLSGLTTNTAYMEESVRTFINGMVNTFKQQLGIHSPSKVTMALGELCGEGFADGLLEMVKTVKEAAKDITDTVKSSLDMSDSLSAAKNTLSVSAGYNRNAGSFGGDRTQVINFNQYNNSPKSLDRLTIYRQTNNMLFQAKVGLSNV